MGLKQIGKTLLYRAAPQWTTAVMSARSRAHSHRVVKAWGGEPVTRALLERFGNRVQQGPFAGLILTPMTYADQFGPYLLGLYESELAPAWETVLRGAYSQIVDVGAHFGYYAVGLARKYPDATVIAFDTDWWARRALREMAVANGTPNVEVKGLCTAAWLASETRDGSLIVSDCEGYEATLFADASIDRLRSAVILIETHDTIVPGVAARLRQAFGQTHAVLVYRSGNDRKQPACSLEFLTESQRTLATQEVRPRQDWLLCLPRAGRNQALHARSHSAGMRVDLSGL